jgi:Ca2+-binding RTX toxin-like protein
MNYQAGGGSETINSVFSLSNDSLSGGTVAGSTVSMVGGAGNDTFSAGAGTDTMVGAGGNNLFLFTKAVLTAAPSDVVSQFTSNDQVLLAGYGAGEAQHALSTATSAFNNTTLTLSDNTKITFLGTSLQQLIGHVSSN